MNILTTLLATDLFDVKVETQSAHFFQVQVQVQNGVYQLKVQSNLITSTPMDFIPWTKIRPKRTSTYELELKFSADNVKVWFKNDFMELFNFKSELKGNMVISKFSHLSNGTTSRIQFSSGKI